MEKSTVEREYTDLLSDDDFDVLAQLLRQPNIFEILRVTGYEIRHSNFLAWLLDPEGTHGFGNIFLFKFLKDALSSSISTNISVTEAVSLSSSKVLVYREWNNIDILLEFPNLVLVIENKVWSGEHSDQLSRYTESVKKHFNGLRHFFVFLTPYGSHSSIPEVYTNYSYKSIVKNLESLIRTNKDSLNESSRLYIGDYIKTIRRHFMNNSEANDLAKKIYYSHKNLMDFIIANRPDPILEIMAAISNRLKFHGHVLGSPGPAFVRFLSKKLDPLVPRDGGSRGWPGKESFLFEIKLDFEPKKLRIYCTLPPDPCKSKQLLKKALDTAFEPMPDHQGWIPYFDRQLNYVPFDIASQGSEAIEAFVDEIWPTIETMIKTAEDALIPLLTTKEITNEQLN